jgi:2,3-bisphosphoglycerate-independent phosphoglycerate mutase
MAVCIGLTDNVTLELGEMKERLIAELDKDNVKYEIMFDKINKNNVKETIVHLKEIDTEISISNDIVTYARLGNNKFTQLDAMSDNSESTSIAEHINKIKKQIHEIFNDNTYNIKIEKLDSATMNITLILESKGDKARAQVVRDTRGKIYISTLMLI